MKPYYMMTIPSTDFDSVTSTLPKFDCRFVINTNPDPVDDTMILIIEPSDPISFHQNYLSVNYPSVTLSEFLSTEHC